MQTPQPPGALNPVFRMSQFCNLGSEQNDAVLEPPSPVLLDIENDASVEGNEGGSGPAILLLSRWSSTRDVKEEIVVGTMPVREVEDKSLERSRS